MSLYNAIRGFNPACFWLLPMLGKHPDEYPRFLDCFYGAVTQSPTEKDEFGLPEKEVLTDEKVLSIYNRGYESIPEYEKMPNFVRWYPDNGDHTYMMCIFTIPERWMNDFDAITSGDISKVSKEYIEEMKRVYPKLTAQIDEVFSNKETYILEVKEYDAEANKIISVSGWHTWESSTFTLEEAKAQLKTAREHQSKRFSGTKTFLNRFRISAIYL